MKADRVFRALANKHRLGILFWLQNPRAVSYTHLDVYKRQASGWPALSTRGMFRALGGRLLSTVRRRLPASDASAVPVSYTHLDVYKRQALQMQASVSHYLGI